MKEINEKVLIDIYKTKNPYSGLGQFSMSFAQEMARQIPQNIHAHFLAPKSKNRRVENDNITYVQADFQKRYFPFLNNNYRLWHSLHQFPSHFPKKNTKWILTIHDLNFLVEKNEEKGISYLKKLQQNIDKADCITTISNYTKTQIEKHLDLGGKKVQVIYNGVENGSNEKQTRPTFIGRQKFFFSIGIFNKKKNFEVLIPLMAQFPDYHLIIAGNNETEYGKYLRKEVDRLGLTNRVIFSGKIDDSEKNWLYANCEAFLFPSLAEGFGMPVIEAMYAGRPVFLSQFTSLPEIGGEAAFYFENFEVENMAETIQKGLDAVSSNPENFALKTKKHAEQFNWENCIKQYLELYSEII